MAKSDNKLTVRVDMARNRLYFVIDGCVTKTDLDRFFTDVRFGVADMKPGFEVITDLTDCNLSHLAALSTFRRVMHYLIDRGVSEVVRVVNTKNIIYRQAMNLASRIPGYNAVYVNTIEEAEQFLDKSGGRIGLRFSLVDKSLGFETENAMFKGGLIDISISGCAIRAVKHVPEVNSSLTVTFSLVDKKQQPLDFKIKGLVARHFDDGFAVAFKEFVCFDKDKLWECLVQESRQEIETDRLLQKILSPETAN